MAVLIPKLKTTSMLPADVSFVSIERQRPTLDEDGILNQASTRA
jgi:hypothetical protein